MKNQSSNIVLPRRTFLSNTAAAVVAFSVYPLTNGCAKKSESVSELETPVGINSNFGGVQIGTITYSFRSMSNKSAQDMLRYCIEAGVSSTEYMAYPAEIYAGIPLGPGPDIATIKQNIGGKELIGRVFDHFDFTKMTIAQVGGWGFLPGNEEQRKWRMSVPMTKFEELRKMYNDAGVYIHMMKFSPATCSDQEIEYAFRVGKTRGGKALSDELDWVEGAVPRLASYAEKHDMYAAFHVHEQFGNEGFSVDPYLTVSPAVMLSFDAGHYYGVTGQNPCGFIEKYHERIFNIHLKDKTGPNTDPPNTNQVWGQGETPLRDVLLLLKEHAGEEDWPKYVDIELEYPVPEWSDPVKEVRKCLNYAKCILTCD